MIGTNQCLVENKGLRYPSEGFLSVSDENRPLTHRTEGHRNPQSTVNSSRPPLSRRLYEPETLLESASLVTITIGSQHDSTAKAALSLERSCPINSMAPVLAIVSMVATLP